MGRRIAGRLSNCRGRSGVRNLDNRGLHSAGRGLLRSFIASSRCLCRGKNLPQRRRWSCRCHFVQGPCDSNHLRHCELVEPVYCPSAYEAYARPKTAPDAASKTNAAALVRREGSAGLLCLGFSQAKCGRNLRFSRTLQVIFRRMIMRSYELREI